jgi:hypothetical protein
MLAMQRRADEFVPLFDPQPSFPDTCTSSKKNDGIQNPDANDGFARHDQPDRSQLFAVKRSSSAK